MTRSLPPRSKSESNGHLRRGTVGGGGEEDNHSVADGPGDYTDGSESEHERGWFGDSKGGAGANGLPEPIGTVARSGQLGAPLGIAHLALGAVTAAMTAFNPVKSGKLDGDGLPRVRMLSCLHALFTQLHDPEFVDDLHGDVEAESGRSRAALDSTELDVLEKAVRILHLRYRSCLRPLTKGRLPSRVELKELRVSAEALGVRAAVFCLDKVPKGDPRRLPLFAFRTFALRAELDAEALRHLKEPSGEEWDLGEYHLSTNRLHDLLEDIAEEVQSLWNATNRTVYDVAVVLAPVLAQYALLGKAVAMAIDQYKSRLTVRKHGRVIVAVGDEIILWNDALESVRELFSPDKPLPIPSSSSSSDAPLGPTIRIDSMHDYSWFVKWNGTSAVDSIPSEVSVKKLLHSIGSPSGRAASLRATDKNLLMAASLPEVRTEAEARVVKQLDWVADFGIRLELKQGRLPSLPENLAVRVSVGGGGSDEGKNANGNSGSSNSSNGKNNDIGNSNSSGTGGIVASSGKGKQVQLRRSFAKRLDSVLDSPFSEDPEPAKEVGWDELVEATKDWADDMKLGEGGSAVVYKGVGPEGLIWAVKRGKKGGLMRLKDYQKEIDAVSKMSHPHLVHLLGYCDEKDEQVLVYEYVSNGTLREHLNPLQGGNPSSSLLSFEKRLEVAVGVAEGLHYLHSSSPPLIHRDVKSLNVFLNEDMQPKLGDFGNLKLVEDESSPMHTRVVGTPGYLDPQYCQTSIVTDKSDVYSFGVVMLELITGKSPVMKEGDEGTGERMALAKWATPAICAGNVDTVVDPRLGSNYAPHALQAFASLAAMCVQRQPKDRPAMSEVVRRLKTIRSQAAFRPSAPVSTPARVNGTGSTGPPKRSGSGRFLPIVSPPTPPLANTPPLSPRPSGSSPFASFGSFDALSPKNGPTSNSSGGGKKMFSRDFWKPRRSPSRSLSEASMHELSEYLDDVDDPSSANVTPKSHMHRGGGAGSGRGGNNNNSNNAIDNSRHSPSNSGDLSVPKSKSADGGALHARSSSMMLSTATSEKAPTSPLHEGRKMYSLGRRSSKSKELVALLKLQHPNLAPVVGFEKEESHLSHELPPGCSCLENFLLPEDMDSEPLSLRLRLKIAIGTAKGIAYLHSNLIVHGNINSCTIMLDKNFSVLLTSYGITPAQPKGTLRRSSKTGPQAMVKDTYSYGIVLFELLTGRRSGDVAEKGVEALSEWSEPLLEELEQSPSCSDSSKRMVLRMLEVLAKECMQDDPRCRPSMKDLVSRLFGLQETING